MKNKRLCRPASQRQPSGDPFRRAALLLIAAVLSIVFVPGFAATLGPASSYEELAALAESAQAGDTILLSGNIDCAKQPALVLPVNVTLSSESGDRAAISALSLHDANVSLRNLDLVDTLTVTGHSSISVERSASVTGARNHAAIDYSGSGLLLVERGASVRGGSSSTGIAINHDGGEFYAGIEGSVSGGSGDIGGTGIVIQSLGASGVLMISGDVTGGSGDSVGGHALDLFDLSDNAYITVDGSLNGGSGLIGGNGIEIVSVAGSASVGIGGSVTGGDGSSFGGDGLVLMNVGGSALVSMTGTLNGGDTLSADSTPGSSVVLVGHTTASHANLENCTLREGRVLLGSDHILPMVTPLPSLPDSQTQPTVLPDWEQIAEPEFVIPSPEPDQNDIMEATPSETFPADMPDNADISLEIPQTAETEDNADIPIEEVPTQSDTDAPVSDVQPTETPDDSDIPTDEVPTHPDTDAPVSDVQPTETPDDSDIPADEASSPSSTEATASEARPNP